MESKRYEFIEDAALKELHTWSLISDEKERLRELPVHFNGIWNILLREIVRKADLTEDELVVCSTVGNILCEFYRILGLRYEATLETLKTCDEYESLLGGEGANGAPMNDPEKVPGYFADWVCACPAQDWYQVYRLGATALACRKATGGDMIIPARWLPSNEQNTTGAATNV